MRRSWILPSSPDSRITASRRSIARRREGISRLNFGIQTFAVRAQLIVVLLEPPCSAQTTKTRFPARLSLQNPGAKSLTPGTRTLREMWVKIRAFPSPNHDSTIRRFSVMHNIVTRIHRVSTGESTFSLVVYFHFDNVSKVCSPSSVSQSSET